MDLYLNITRKKKRKIGPRFIFETGGKRERRRGDKCPDERDDTRLESRIVEEGEECSMVGCQFGPKK